MSRWDAFKTEAAGFNYPTTTVGKDVFLPFTTGIEIWSERDVDRVVGNHLDNFNRIFRDQGKDYRFNTKVEANLDDPTQKGIKFIGSPGFVLTLGPKVLSFIEDKTPNTLPVKHPRSGDYFDLVQMYKEDMKQKKSNRNRGNVGRMEVLKVINQVYGYLAFNNLPYGCVTCYDVTYFLFRPQEGRLLISDPIYNYSSSPTLLQSIYYFVQLVESHDTGVQTLEASPIDSEMPDRTEFSDESEYESQEQMETDEHETQETSDTGSNYSTHKKIKRKRYVLDIDALRNGFVVGSGATGQAIRLKDSNIVVKQCDTYNNPDGFQMLKNEIKIYQSVSKYNLKCIPRYYGECQYFGQHFIAMDYIPGKHCDWTGNDDLTRKLDNAVEELKAVGVTHQDLRPENVILTDDGDIKLIDFGLAKIESL
ncbi:hypothetical protein HDV06_001958 [Boothiomyces sp. JEL0866]|nr:hypothetical protein HDV06_001958 [Boothiomyces sp. JEL0866]